MHRTFPLLCLLLLAASCQFTGNQSAPAGSEDSSGITLEEDTTLGRGHLVSTIELDKEYGFVYSVSVRGTNDLGQKVDMKSFEVTSFTDKPTAKDIPNPAQSGGDAATALKKQLQDQLNAMKK